MKKLIYIFVLAGVLSCGTHKNVGSTQKAVTQCKECTVEVLHNKNITILGDANTGTYYNITDDTQKTVIKYIYGQNTNTPYQDSGYTETLLLTLPNELSEGTFKNKELSKLNAALDVQCYCKGKAGVYKINEGVVSLVDKVVTVTIPSVVDNQKLTSFSFQLK
ncbi:hypothetical protein [Neptunitalea lumnitzerae]|uniref:Lipoprotein n=1 Tax=Neptunitalea lumnitzerae TaxID=2965509 RepID=A0ABQ5MF17_9FLAO|nr:hypothetical protein [Neptunitalea sp. Y10]GLB48001.1 hypothetical protein Y10_03690 [Neptunitalea sp. Y10]